MAQTVGIVTSLTWTDPFKARFETGYGAGIQYATASPLEANGDYDSEGKRNKKLYRQMRQLNKPAPTGATIVVSVGGLVAAHPVVQRATQPFIVLIGRIPEAVDFMLRDNENFCGGVELNMVRQNVKRRDALFAAFPAIGSLDNIFLLYNPNARMGRSEANEWIAQPQGGDTISAVMPGLNDVSEFTRVLNRLPNNAGVVVSSDPYFLNQQSALVGAANVVAAAKSIKFCYPFDAFGSPTAPTPGTAISYGPDIGGAYQLMGQKARAVAAALDNNLSPIVGLDTAPMPANPTVY